MSILSFTRWFGASRRSRRPRAAGTPRAAVERLETRDLLAAIMVTNTLDSGPGSLRQAIDEAIVATEASTIEFAIPETDLGFVDVDSGLTGGDAEKDVFRISLLSQLRDIHNPSDHPIIIDAGTQHGTTGDSNPFGPEVELDGSALSGGHGLVLASDHITIQGFSVHSFSTLGILIRDSQSAGLYGNYIGTDSTGTQAKPNGIWGVQISNSVGSLIGDINASDRNVISGNAGYGVEIGNNSTGTRLLNNYIGTNATGDAAIPNSFSGVSIWSTDVAVGIGGAGNVISGNLQEGIRLLAAARDVKMLGNHIGTNAAGTHAIPNRDGILIISDGLLPTEAVIRDNVISGNSSSGTVVVGGADDVTFTGNRIGTAADWETALPNQSDGILITGGSNITIGGTPPVAPNTIAFNGSRGVAIVGDATEAVSVRGNSIHSNAALGIDIHGDGVTSNDPQDTDTGPNGVQNYPVIESVVFSETETIITGSLNGIPNATFDVDVYESLATSASQAEGKTFLGTTPASADASGDAAFSLILARPLNPGLFLSATATGVGGSTSEFSPAAARDVKLIVVESDGSTRVTESGATDELTIRLSHAPSSTVVVVAGSDDPTESTVGPTSLTFTPDDWNIPQTLTVAGVDDSVVDDDISSRIILSIDPSSALEYTGIPNSHVNLTTLDGGIGGNLALNTEPILVHGTPTVGESMSVQVFWTTEGLDTDPNYDIEVEVNGIPLRWSGISLGASENGRQSWFGTFGGWYARAGTHTLTVTVDPENRMAEADETDNVRTLTFTSAEVQDLPQKFVWPLAGTSGRDWAIGNYLDVDPRPGSAADYRGGPFQYNGHPGIDIGPPNYARVEEGLPILAAADGIVADVDDAHADHQTGPGNENIPSNFVEINHGNGWVSVYYHNGRHSATVQPGEEVTRGQVIGYMASSGEAIGSSNGPHLHFAVLRHDRFVEPFLDADSYFVDPLPYQGDVAPTVLDILVTNYSSFGSPDAGERMSAVAEFSQTEDDTAVLVYHVSNLRVGDNVAVRWKRPDGTVAQNNGFISNGVSSNHNHEWQLDHSIWQQQTGTWGVEVELAGVLQATTTFDVVADLAAPEIRVRNEGELVLDGRTSAFDFGSVAIGEPGPTMDFQIENHGGSDLTLGTPQIPSGFALVGAFPTVIEADSSATFTIRFEANTPGRRFEEFRFTTNDVDEASFDFIVEGTVTGASVSGTPVLELNDSAGVGYVLGAEPQLLNPDIDINAPGATVFDGARLLAERVAGGSSDDTLAILGVGSGPDEVDVSGMDVTFSDIVIGALSHSSQTSFAITFNSNADMAAIQAVARRLAWASGDIASVAPRTIRIQYTDSDGLTSQPVYREIVSVRPQLIMEIERRSPDSIVEGSGMARATIRRTGSTSSDLVVSLTSDDVTEATVPTSITIPAGQTTTTFSVWAADDSDFDGAQRATITASATDFLSVNDAVTVIDDETAHAFHVLNTLDSGPGSFRQAIFDANQAMELSKIVFAIPDADSGFVDVDSGLPGGDGDRDVFRIALQSQLPDIANTSGFPIIIDGNTQQAASGDSNPAGPEIELDGAAITNGHGLVLASNQIIVRGFTVHSFSTVGILVVRSDSAVVAANYIGTDAIGRQAKANGQGIQVAQNSTNVLLGGASEADRNIVSGNTGTGVSIFDNSSGIVLQDNFIGTNASGTAAIPNTGGIHLSGDASKPTDMTIRNNVISGNAFRGIAIDGGANEVTLTGNRIGTSSSGTLEVPNEGDGIYILDSSNITIGTTSPGDGNIIAYNGLRGVSLATGITAGIRIRGNSIHSNGLIGIDLHEDGTTPNDPQDPDTGANGLQNFPVIDAVTMSMTHTTVWGSLNSTANSTFDIDIYANAVSAENLAEGQTFLGTITVNTDAFGDATFSIVLPTPLNPGVFVTAAATDHNGNTSEFSAGTGTVDLVATAFNAVTDHVLNGQTDVTFSVRNSGTGSVGPFDTYIIWSPNEIVGDEDDVIVAGTTESFAGLNAGATSDRTISVQLNKAALYAHAVASNAVGLAVGTVSDETSYLFLAIDPTNRVVESNEGNNQGQGQSVDSDNITYLPWDHNGNGTVTPIEALQAIQAVNTSIDAFDFDGNGVVTPLEALAVLQRIGYRVNSSVVADAGPLAPNVADVNFASRIPTVAAAETSFWLATPAFSFPPTDGDNDLFATEDETDVVLQLVATSDAEDFASLDTQFSGSPDWLSIL